MPFKSEKQRRWMHANNPKMAAKWEKKEKKMKREQKVKELIKKMVREEMAGLDETAKRDYKAEYKKFQSSDKSKKYRAELNKYNRQKGTYGNGDGKDASHKGGKIVGFEKESVNRGRAEKSRLKKEEKLNERLHVVDERYVGKYIIWVLQDGNKIRTAVMGKKGFDNISSNDPDDLKKLWNLAKKFKGKPIPDIATEGKLTEAGVNVWHFYKKANKDKNKFFKMLSDFRKKHSDTKWIKMLNYALDDFNENPKKYKTIDDKQNILFKNLQNNKKVKEGKLKEKALKKNPEIFVPDKFSKVIDKLPNSKITKDIVIKLAKKLKVDKDDALRYVSYGYGMDFGLKEDKLKETVNKINEKLSKSEIKKMKDKFDKTGKLPPHLVKLSKLIDKHTEIRNVIVPGLEWMADIDEGKVDEMIDMTINNPDMWKQEKLWKYYTKATDAGKTVFVKLLKDKKKHYIWQAATASSIRVTDLKGKKSFTIKPKDVYQVVQLPHSGYKVPKGFTEGKLSEKKKTIPLKDVPSYMKDHYPTQKHWDYYQSLPKGKKYMYYKKYPNILAKQSKKTDDFIAQQKKELGLEGKLTEGGKEIAKTILQQLGGNKFIAMTGAKNLGHTNKGLQMKIGRNSKGITHVIINLKASDTYEMEFIKLRGPSRKVVKKVSGVYNDMLGKIFTKYTGMRTSLWWN